MLPHQFYHIHPFKTPPLPPHTIAQIPWHLTQARKTLWFPPAAAALMVRPHPLLPHPSNAHARALHDALSLGVEVLTAGHSAIDALAGDVYMWGRVTDDEDQQPHKAKQLQGGGGGGAAAAAAGIASPATRMSHSQPLPPPPLSIQASKYQPWRPAKATSLS